MGGEKKEEEGKKEEEVPQEIVVKVDMHCEGCARKVARALKGFQGVEEVRTEWKESKVVVKGKHADPMKVCERIQKKTTRKVQLLSPLPKETPPPPPSSGSEDKKEENKETPPPPPVPEDKKEEPPAVITVILNVQMHCEACAQVLEKRIRKLKGVESVTTELGKNQVVVTGIFDPEKLVADVYKRTRKQASIVKEEEKKEEAKKEEDKRESEEGDGKKSTDDINKKSECSSPPRYYYMEYANYPPQFFSDENPNACSLM